MTDSQRIYLMADLWPRACKTQRWNKGDRALRLRVFSEALGRGLTSASEINATSDFDHIKAHLLMLADNVQGTIETDHPEIGDRRRLLWKYQHVQRPCLGVYVEDVDAYVRQILRERFKLFEGISTVEDLSPDPRLVFTGGRQIEKPSPLLMLITTLDARLNSMRQKAGHSIHQMRTMAGVKCDCAECSVHADHAANVVAASLSTADEPF
jgi:hypothetical protein